MSAAAHTAPAAEADLFGGEQLDQAAEDLANVVRTSKMTFTGVVLGVEIRTRPAPQTGAPETVVRIEVRVDGAVPHTIRAERPHQFRQEAEREAASLHKGQRIRFASSLLGMRVYLPAVDLLPLEPSEP